MGLFSCFVLLNLGIQIGFPVILLVAVYGVDSVGTILFRASKKQNIFVAHREHVYQKFANELGVNHLKVSGVYGFVQLCINILLIWMLSSDDVSHTYLTIGVFLLLSLSYILLRSFLFKDLFVQKNLK
jgi:hypothetical protein